MLVQHKGHERIGEAWKHIRRALPVVTLRINERIQDGNKLKDQNQHNAQSQGPGPVLIDWLYFWPTLIFVGHYL